VVKVLGAAEVRASIRAGEGGPLPGTSSARAEPAESYRVPDMPPPLPARSADERRPPGAAASPSAPRNAPSAAPRVVLTEVRRLPEEGRLRLTWSDGHTGELPYGYLRGWCPCAGCQGHALVLRHRPPAGEVVPETIRPVGNYAISIAWSDRHATGIYRYDYLRRLCPCEACGGPVEGEIHAEDP